MAHLQAYKGLAWGHVEGAAVSLSRLSLGGVQPSGQQVRGRACRTAQRADLERPASPRRRRQPGGDSGAGALVRD